MNDMEETYYWEITKSRMEVIEKFKNKIVDTQALEKVAQKYLFEHLWLLDPTWDRISDPHMEKDLTAELKKIQPDTEAGARIDIAYRSSAGRQIIIELKRPGLRNIKKYRLIEQIDKYRDAITVYISNHPEIFNTYKGASLPFEICILLEHDISKDDQDLKRMLDIKQARIITYNGLLTSASRVYSSYIEANKKVTNINKFIDQI